MSTPNWGDHHKKVLGVGALLILLPTGCAYAPSIDILGSFFPAWMVCIVSGIGLTLLARQLLIIIRLDPYLGPRGLIYPSLTLLLTLVIWLLFFRN